MQSAEGSTTYSKMTKLACMICVCVSNVCAFREKRRGGGRSASPAGILSRIQNEGAGKRVCTCSLALLTFNVCFVELCDVCVRVLSHLYLKLLIMSTLGKRTLYFGDF